MLALIVAGFGCGQIEQEPLLDEEGEPVPLPGAYDRWLKATLAPAPGPLAPDSPLVVQFTDYIDDDTIRSYDFGRLRSGGLDRYGRARYVMTDKTVVWQPWSPLDAGLYFDFTIITEPTSVTGSPLLSPADQPTYVVTPEAEPVEPPALPSVRWDAVEPIVEARCASCHRDPSWGLNPLTYDSLVGVRSEQVPRPLVRPFDAPDSYLMHKLLWDYPLLRYTPQPPPWSAGAAQLPRDELLTIEGWIASGARR